MRTRLFRVSSLRLRDKNLAFNKRLRKQLKWRLSRAPCKQPKSNRPLELLKPNKRQLKLSKLLPRSHLLSRSKQTLSSILSSF